MKLIDAYKIKDFLSKFPLYEGKPLTDDEKKLIGCVVETIEGFMPTAYDVDKVIEKLEAKKIHRFHEASGRSNYKSLAHGYILANQDAVEIVKRGGIND